MITGIVKWFKMTMNKGRKRFFYPPEPKENKEFSERECLCNDAPKNKKRRAIGKFEEVK